MHITKMHGAGNDFVIINNIQEKTAVDELPELARLLCKPHTGIGADGLMAVTESTNGADYAMLFYNSDGSVGEMCGNGARCICRYGFEHGLAGRVQRVETVSGIITGERIDDVHYRVRLNDPSVIDLHRTVSAGGRCFDSAYIELGVPGLPHAVIRYDEWEKTERAELFELGRTLCHASQYPKGANVSFVRRVGPDILTAVTFERGVEDFTLACGTGCGSIVTAMSLLGEVSGNDVRVTMPGGTLVISLEQDGDRVRNILMTGPAVLVFEGELGELG